PILPLVLLPASELRAQPATLSYHLRPSDLHQPFVTVPKIALPHPVRQQAHHPQMTPHLPPQSGTSRNSARTYPSSCSPNRLGYPNQNRAGRETKKLSNVNLATSGHPAAVIILNLRRNIRCERGFAIRIAALKNGLVTQRSVLQPTLSS